MSNRFVRLMGLAAGAIAALFGGWTPGLTILSVMMAVDYLTGVLVAITGKSPKSEGGGLSSKAGFTGIARKGFIMLIVLVATQLDRAIGNTAMVCLVLVGCMYCDIDVTVWLVIVEAVVGLLLCLTVEFFRGIGDVSRAEKTVFEDEEYIYYVKAVPKLKVSQPEPNVKNMNESLYEEDQNTQLPDESPKTEEEGESAEISEGLETISSEPSETEESKSSDTSEKDADKTEKEPENPTSSGEEAISEEQTERS